MDHNHVNNQCTIQTQRLTDNPEWQQIHELDLRVGTPGTRSQQNHLPIPVHDSSVTEGNAYMGVALWL